MNDEQLRAEFNAVLFAYYAAYRKMNTTPSSKFPAAADEWFEAVEVLGVFLRAHPEFKQFEVRKQSFEVKP